MTKEQIKRIADDWSEMAGEPVEVELIVTSLYGFCSELGVLRIMNKYRTNEAVLIGYSKNLKRHYVVMENLDDAPLETVETALVSMGEMANEMFAAIALTI